MLPPDTIAVFGGSFNPPHMGHQIACLYLLEALGCAEVWLVPAAEHPFGKELLPFKHRAAMLELLAAPLGSRVQINPVETTLSHGGKTYETLRHLQRQYPKKHFAFVVGADILAEAKNWYRWNDLEKEFTIVVLGRTGFKGGDKLILPAVSSSEVRSALSADKSVEGWVPLKVIDYIRTHGLYH